MNRYKKQQRKWNLKDKPETSVDRLSKIKTWADIPPAPTAGMNWDQLMNYYEDTNEHERRQASLTPQIRALDERAKALKAEAEIERKMKFVNILNERFELKELGDGSYYGYAESDDLYVLDEIQLEVQKQGLEVRLIKGEQYEWRLEFLRKNRSGGKSE